MRAITLSCQLLSPPPLTSDYIFEPILRPVMPELNTVRGIVVLMVLVRLHVELSGRPGLRRAFGHFSSRA
jgi:hypothetical protein